MMNNDYKILVFLLAVSLLLAACSKVSHIQGETDPDSEIAFFNASEYLKLQQQNSTVPCFLLIDKNDWMYTGSLTVHDSIPYFAPGTNEFPLDGYDATVVCPWIQYLRLYQGTHTVTVTDTAGHHPMITAQVATVNAIPGTVYFADSLGAFRYWAVPDTTTVPAGSVGLRVIDLSPDAGNVFFAIGGQPAAGFPAVLNYGQVTPFISWPDTLTGLNVGFYAVGDSSVALVNISLSISPGHSYNIVLNGYQNSQSFPDPITGNMLTFSPDLNIALTQDN